jgi:hypothetical protein
MSLISRRIGRRVLVATGVSRSPGTAPEADRPDTTPPAFTHDNIHSRD